LETSHYVIMSFVLNFMFTLYVSMYVVHTLRIFYQLFVYYVVISDKKENVTKEKIE
jgi:hypothetical protein